MVREGVKFEVTGKEFRKWRRNQDITQQQVADLVEVNKSTISRWENGLINVQGGLYNKLSEFISLGNYASK